MYVEFPAFLPPRGPRFSDFEPAVPDSEETSNPGFSAQHSSVDALLCAPRTVTFNVPAAAPRVESKGRIVSAVKRILDWNL